MTGNIKRLQVILLSTFTLFLSINATYAATKYKIAEIDPRDIELNIYRSYKYKLFIIGIIHKTSESFNCSPNRYIFYRYGTDQLFQISAGNLLINSDFTNIFATKVYSLDALTKENELGWKLEVKRIIKKLNTSSEILEKNKIRTAKGSVCWQQPIIYNIQGEIQKKLPQLIANFCPNQFCTDIYWKTSKKVQFWHQFSPLKVQKFEYDITLDKKRFVKSSNNFIHTSFSQVNAPRDEIVDTAKTKQGIHKISGKKLAFFWHTNKKNKLVIGFQRNNVSFKAADQNLTAISNLLDINDLKRAYQQIRFGLWLLPNHFDTKIERLKLYAKLSIFDQIFRSVKTDFSKSETVKVCQKIHTDGAFKAIWKKEKLVTLFKKTCF